MNQAEDIFPDDECSESCVENSKVCLLFAAANILRADIKCAPGIKIRNSSDINEIDASKIQSISELAFVWDRL